MLFYTDINSAYYVKPFKYSRLGVFTSWHRRVSASPEDLQIDIVMFSLNLRVVYM